MQTVFHLITVLYPVGTWPVSKVLSIGQMFRFHVARQDFNRHAHSVLFPSQEIRDMSNLSFRTSVINLYNANCHAHFIHHHKHKLVSIIIFPSSLSTSVNTHEICLLQLLSSSSKAAVKGRICYNLSCHVHAAFVRYDMKAFQRT